MADDRQEKEATSAAQGVSAERQTIQDALTEYTQRQAEEERRRLAQERRKARDERADARRQARVGAVKRVKENRFRSANEMSERVEAHVVVARRTLQAALRDVEAVSFPRHSTEGRRQRQMARQLEDAMSSLGRIGRGVRLDGDAEMDLDLDIDA